MSLIDTGLTCVGFGDGYLMPDLLKEELKKILKRKNLGEFIFEVSEVHGGFNIYKIFIRREE